MSCDTFAQCWVTLCLSYNLPKQEQRRKVIDNILVAKSDEKRKKVEQYIKKSISVVVKSP